MDIVKNNDYKLLKLKYDLDHEIFEKKNNFII